MFDNPDFISGVFNYCDAWCDRCPFTSRCATFAMGNEMERADKAGDLEHAGFCSAWI